MNAVTGAIGMGSNRLTVSNELDFSVGDTIIIDTVPPFIAKVSEIDGGVLVLGVTAPSTMVNFNVYRDMAPEIQRALDEKEASLTDEERAETQRWLRNG